MQYPRNNVFPPAIKTIIILNVVIYVLMYFTQSVYVGGMSIYEFVLSNFALFPLSGEVYGMPSFYPWQLLTYQFVHGGFTHILFNLFTLWMFGREIEAEWGAKKFTIFYLISGIGAGLMHLAIAPLLGTYGPTVGASGALYGVFVAFAMMNPESRIMIFPIFIPLKAKYVVIGMIAFDMFLGINDTGNIAHFAHVGGAITGFLLMKFGNKNGTSGWFAKNKLRHSNRTYSGQVYTTDWTANDDNVKYQPEVKPKEIHHIYYNGEEITQAMVDEILDKISSKGYAGLTDREKSILFEISKKM